MLWMRGLLFTVLVPGVIGAYIPCLISVDHHPQSGFRSIGWAVTILGALVYGQCLVAFLLSGGTPAIFFSRPLRFVLGDEPPMVVQRGVYRVSRNPMYLGVVLAVFGQAILFGSAWTALYGVLLSVLFHLVVVFAEEPHLRRKSGHAYEEYCRRVPRWLGWPKPKRI